MSARILAIATPLTDPRHRAHHPVCLPTTGDGLGGPVMDSGESRSVMPSGYFFAHGAPLNGRTGRGGRKACRLLSPVRQPRSVPLTLLGGLVCGSLIESEDSTMTHHAHLATVEFHGHALITLTHNGEAYFAPRPICQAIGLDWAAQFSRIKRNPVLSEGVVIMTTPSNGGAQETVALPLKLLNGWLFGIEAGRVKPALRETILTYQRECYDALAAYWQQGRAENPRAEARLNVKQALLAELSPAEVALPAEVQRLVDEKAFALSLEAHALIREHIARRVAYYSECGHPQRRVHVANAKKAISRITLGNALAQEHWRAIARTESALEMMESMIQKTRGEFERAMKEAA